MPNTTEDRPTQNKQEAGLSLITRRRIAASPERVFAAWTHPDHLKRWWGPTGVDCTAAEVDLRVDGRYRLANLLPDGSTVWITGTFIEVQPPHKLVYGWAHEPVEADTLITRVTVRFEPRGDATEVVVVHERLPNEETRQAHSTGWEGCLDGLSAHFVDPSAPAPAG